MSQLSPRITTKHLVIERLIAIKLHADWLRRRFRRAVESDPTCAPSLLAA
jgi:hypothetical protein